MTVAGASGLVALAVAVVWLISRLRVVAEVSAGYRAKAVCTGVFGSRRALDADLLAQVSDDSYWLLRPYGVRRDTTRHTVTASLHGLFPRTAVHRDGYGATLLAGAPPATLPAPPAIRMPDRTWPVSAAAASLQRLVDDAFDEPDPKRLRRTYAVVVVHDGRIVAERYRQGLGPDTPLPGWSMAKSVLNALVGILVRDGIMRLDDRALLPAWQAPDDRAAITIEDLLRMRSGLRFSENYGFPWSDVLRMLYRSRDMAGFAAGLPLVAAPGSAWSYSSGTTNILSALIRQAVGDGTYHGFPRRALFDPLGMSSAVLEPDPAGTFVCSSYMLATARDWARFGQLFLDNGVWRGSRLLPESWVGFSTAPTAGSEGRFGAHWWLKLNPEIGGDSADAAALAPDAFFAVGHEAQILSVVPSRRLVVVRLGASIYIDAWNHAAFLAGIQHETDRL